MWEEEVLKRWYVTGIGRNSTYRHNGSSLSRFSSVILLLKQDALASSYNFPDST
jgi:hypothetical protein